MNKKEVSEIKKNFADFSGFFTMERVLTGFIDAEKNLRYRCVNSCLTMPVEDKDVYDETLNKVLNTNVGKNFIEYKFPQEAYQEGNPQNILYTLLSTELKDETVCDNFLNHIANTYLYSGPFTVITAYCTYTIRKMSKDDVVMDGEDEIYRYILTAICPADTSSDGFVFDNVNNEIQKKLNTELIINKAPLDGFLFPTFSDRSPDVNSVMYYTKSKSKPNISVVEDVLGCNYTMSADNEKESFRNILKTVVGDDLDFGLINAVNEKLSDLVFDNRNETETTIVEPSMLADMLRDIGVSEDKLKTLEPAYKHICGECNLTASNLVENKTIINTDGVAINIKSSATNNVRTGVINGRKCVIIDVDEPVIDVNGMSISLA